MRSKKNPIPPVTEWEQPFHPRPTIEDIARLAEVGRGTVSRVLNNHPAVSDETRARVLEVIKRLNYVPNYSARHMRTENSNLVGFVTDEVITTPYAVDMIRGAQEALFERGKMMLVVSAGYSLPVTQWAVETLIERRVEGIVYAAMYHRAVDLPPQITRVPVVLANCFMPDRSLPSVVPDEVSGGYTATRKLLQRGHRRIAFLNLGMLGFEGRMPPLPAAHGRLEGYKRALADYDIPFDETLLRFASARPNYNFEQACALMRLQQPPTAIFCGNDRIAMDCYAALASLRLRIPEDVAVIGFDNLRDAADGLNPPLTSMQLPHYEMGKWAVDCLLSGDVSSRPPIQHQIACPLVQRASI